jgi:hypothetical protein
MEGADHATVRHRCTSQHLHVLRPLLARFGIELTVHPQGDALPGSFWGEPEAGIVGQTLHVRPDTPVHSALHEACHLICMDPLRRAGVHTDAGGDDAEESAVCRLQILLADHLPGIGREALMDDMDAWGYSFRLGSAARWFDADSEDADAWLRSHGLADATGRVTFNMRDDAGS